MRLTGSACAAPSGEDRRKQMINRTNVVTALAKLMLVALFFLPGAVGAIGAGLVDECNAEHGTDNCIVAGVCRLTDQYERSFTIGPFGTSWTVCRYDGCMGVLDDPLTAVEATFMSAVGPNQ